MKNSKSGLFFISLTGLTLLAGCAGNTSVFQPASRNAQATNQLLMLVFGIAAVVFLVVEGILLFTYFRFSRKSNTTDGLPTQTEGNHRLEIGWTMVPAVILGVVFIFSLRTLQTVSTQPGTNNGAEAANTVQVRVTGHRWFWEFDYPDQHIITANELHIPIGVPVKIELQSADVIHSFWVPELGGKMDAIPGTSNTLWILADKAGIYDGQCAEFCGVEHALMRMQVVAETQDQFNAWLAQQQAPIPTNLSVEAAKGEGVLLSGSCVGCHTIDGTKARGVVGPNLTHFASRQTFAGSFLTNTPENLSKWLASPQAVKPGNLMPDLHLPDSSVQQLVSFLESLK
jgi:cytochrome c oxidase subunit 2